MTLEENCRLSYYQPVSEIDREHGVILVRHTENGNFYVLKTLSNYSRPVFESLLRDPAGGMPAVVDLFEGNGTLAVIEEYLPGRTLRSILDEKGKLDRRTAYSYMRQLCAIADGLHRRTPAIVHRDIKPSNIMVLPDGTLRLLDLDAARFHSSEKNSDTVLLGTAGFAAPEQYGFAESSPLADIYALGVVFNVMLTGELPSEKRAKGFEGRIIARCTRLDPAERFQSVRALNGSLALRGINAGLYVKDPARLRFLPPGISSGKPFLMLFSLIAYGLIASLGYFADVSDVKPGCELAMRILLPGSVFAIIFFSFNYLGVLDRLPVIRRSRGAARLLLVLLCDSLIFTLFSVLTASLCV